jgi:hypothetical protein
MAVGEQRWRDNWRVLGEPGAVRVELSPFRSTRGRAQLLRLLSPGTPVVIAASAPGANRRCRAFVSRARIEVEREYLAFPSAGAPGYLVEDAPAPVRFFLDHVLAPPPRPAFALPMAAALRTLRGLPWRVVRRVAPGRLVVGRTA